MAYTNLINDIKQAIYNNGEELITGKVLQDVLVEMVNNLGSGYTYKGVATLSTTPDTTTPNIFYLLGEVGTYTNIGSIQHQSGIGIALWNGTAWSYQNVPSSAIVATDATPTANSTNPVQSGGVKKALGDEHYAWTTNRILDLRGGVGTTLPNSQGNTNWGYVDIQVNEGDIITLNARGGNYGAWGWADANNVILSWSGTNVTISNQQFVAPTNAKRFISNCYTYGSYTPPVVSASGSVQAKINDVRADITDVRDNVELNFKEKSVSVTYVSGKFLNSAGSIGNNANYSYGTFSANKGDMIVYDGSASLTFGMIAIQGTANGNIFYKVVALSTSTSVKRYTYICETDGVFAISGVTSNISLKVYTSRIDAEIEGTGMPYATKRIFPSFTLTNGKYRTNAGTIANLGGYTYSSPFELKKGTYIQYDLSNVSAACCIVAEVKSDGTFIRSIYNGTGTAHIANIGIDKDGYYSFSALNECVWKYVIVEFANGSLFYNPPLDNLFLPTQDGLPREILRSPSFVGIVHKWGFIGDSLSSGEQAVYEDGTTTLVRPDKYDYSWGQRLCALNAVEGYNFSAGGQTTKGWCTGSGDRVWAAAQLEANWKEAYCIALGVNDRSASYPKGDPTTDIDLTNYNNNADTFAGWYAGIIQRLRSVNPKCRIFCLTIPYNNQQGYLDNNVIIRDIVPMFTRCYLVDLANYHWTPSGLALNDHLSPAGYQWAAFEINTYIDWIIRNNLDDFQDIAFVGTNYSKDGNG